MYGYYTEQLKTDYNEVWTAWKEIHALIASTTRKAHITRALKNVERLLKKVEKLMGYLPKDDQPPSVKLLTELEGALAQYSGTFSSLCCAVYDLPMSGDCKDSIMEGVRYIDTCITDMKETLKKSLAG